MIGRLDSLRARLAVSMAMALVLAVTVAGLLDDQRWRLPPTVARLMDAEPMQDGLVLGLFALAVLALIWAVSGWSLRPLARASAEAARAGPAHPGARISPHGLPTEIQPLVTACNGALDRLEQAYEAQRRFSADAAHGLRTPLAILSLRLQQGRDHGKLDWSGLDADIAQMTRLVAQLLDLARKERAAGLPAKPLNLCRVAREAAACIAPLVEQAGRELVVDLPDSLAFNGRADDLRDMFSAVLENALRHGAGEIRLAARALGRHYVLEIADEGAGVPAARQAAMFDRFAKADSGSAGSGLGLAIAREVALAHGGDVAFGDGAHCVVRLRLPAI